MNVRGYYEARFSSLSLDLCEMSNSTSDISRDVFDDSKRLDSEFI